MIYVINKLDDIDTKDKKEPIAILDLRNNPYYLEKDFEYSLELQNYEVYDEEKCQTLMNKKLRCFSKNEKFKKRCQKYIEENAEEFLKCDIMNYSYSLEHQKKSIINFDINNEIYEKKNFDSEYEYDYDYDYEKDNDNLSVDDLFNISKDEDDLNKEEETNELKTKEESNIDGREKENFIMINKEDCIEYGLSKKDNNYIECKKYE